MVRVKGSLPKNTWKKTRLHKNLVEEEKKWYLVASMAALKGLIYIYIIINILLTRDWSMV